MPVAVADDAGQPQRKNVGKWFFFYFRRVARASNQPKNTTIMQQPRERDIVLFESIYSQYHLPIYYYILKFVKEQQPAEDLAADAFLKLWRHINTGAELPNTRAFLYTMARNACLDYWKTARLRQHKTADMQYLASREQEWVDVSEIRAEVLEFIYQSIQRLPPRCRKVFQLSYIDGYKNAEIAEMLQISLQTVQNQKATALKTLRLALEDKELVLLLGLLLIDIKSIHIG